jgi:glycosyltransferase involved in cell wall biosynthesis
MNSKERPLVSVLLPVYNGEKYLRESIQGILRQTYADFELLILDDGSTDGSREVVSSFDDARIRYFYHSNCGLAATLNIGLNNACGELIARQDSDDISHIDRLDQQVGFFIENPSTAILGTRALIVDEKGRQLGHHRHPCSDNDIRLSLCFNNPFVHSSVMFRKSAALQVGGYPTSPKSNPPEDYALWIELSHLGSVCNLQSYLVTYCDRKNSLSYEKKSQINTNLIALSARYTQQYLQCKRSTALILSGLVHNQIDIVDARVLRILFCWPALFIAKKPLNGFALCTLTYYWLRILKNFFC